MNLKYLKSAIALKDCPLTSLPEVAIVGRSNAGKSSFLNSISDGKVAYVSQTPGKTRLLNFFQVGENYILVDLPGYGFAARDNDEMKSWQKMIEDYLLYREPLQGLMLIMDCRRDWSEDEEILKKLGQQKNLGFAVVLTKADKLPKAEQKKVIEKIRHQSQLENVFLVSNIKNQGTHEVEDFVYREWVRP